MMRFFGDLFGEYRNITIVDEMIYPTVNGKKYLVTHGNRYNWARFLPYPHFFIRFNSTFLSRINYKISGSHNYFERALIKQVQRRKVDGVICGHSHIPMIKNIGPIKYINCGSWVGGDCTGIVERGGIFQMYEP